MFIRNLVRAKVKCLHVNKCHECYLDFHIVFQVVQLMFVNVMFAGFAQMLEGLEFGNWFFQAWKTLKTAYFLDKVLESP